MYVLHVATLVLIYIIAATGANLVTGYAGLVSLCQAVFYATGAYVSTSLILDGSFSFWAAAPLAILAAGVLAALTGTALLRIGDDYFAVATIGWQLVFWAILNNWESVTRGPMGITAIPAVRLIGLELNSAIPHTILVALAAGGVLWMTGRLVKSPYGRSLRAIRDDPVVAASLGKNVDAFKVSALMISGAIAGLAGALYAPFARFIDPTGFSLAESVLMLSIVIIGGAGDLRGPVVGAVILVAAPEALRFLGLPSAVAANVRQILYGGLLVVTMLYRPRGLVGSYGFERHADSKL